MVLFSIFAKLCNHLHYLTFHHYKKEPHLIPISFIPHLIPISHSPLLRPHNTWQQLIYFLSLWICLFWRFCKNRIIQYVAVCDCLPSLSISFLRLVIHGVACII